MPNQPGTTSNYFSAGTQSLDRDNIDAKIDWDRTPNHHIFGKYSVMKALVKNKDQRWQSATAFLSALDAVHLGSEGDSLVTTTTTFAPCTIGVVAGVVVCSAVLIG